MRVGIIGFGRAGRARFRALTSLGVTVERIASSRAPLLLKEFSGVESPLASPDRWTAEWRELIADPNLECVLICSENHLHERQARAALEAGKHVCVEFPLATTAARASSLWRLAQARNQCLHVEVIGSLTAKHRWAQRMARNSSVSAWFSHFTGGLYRWVERAAQDRLTPLLAFGRLYQAIDLFGPLTLNDASLSTNLGRGAQDASPPHYLLKMTFESAAGVTVTLREERGVTRSRASKITLHDLRGDELKPEPLACDQPQRPLFELDLCHFLAQTGARQFSTIPDYAPSETLMLTHQLCDQVTRYLRGLLCEDLL